MTVLDASGSTPASPSGSISTYHWDLNGNGTFETSCAGPVVGLGTATPGDHSVSVMVTDDNGGVSDPFTTIISVALSPSDERYASGHSRSRRAGAPGRPQTASSPRGTTPRT